MDRAGFEPMASSMPRRDPHTASDFIHFLEDLKGYDSTLGIPPERWLKPAKVKQSGVVEIYVSRDEIREAYEHCPDKLKTFFRLMVYSGSRGTHLIGMFKSFDIRQVIPNEEYPEVAYYPTSGLAKARNGPFTYTSRPALSMS